MKHRPTSGRKDWSGSSQRLCSTSQTEGEPLPELETEATGDAQDLVPALLDAADDLGVEVRIVDAADWKHGGAKGVCKYRRSRNLQPVVEAKARTNQADLAVTLIHEYAPRAAPC